MPLSRFVDTTLPPVFIGLPPGFSDPLFISNHHTGGKVTARIERIRAVLARTICNGDTIVYTTTISRYIFPVASIHFRFSFSLLSCF